MNSSFQPELPFHPTNDGGNSGPVTILIPHLDGQSYPHVFEHLEFIRGRELDYAIKLGKLSVMDPETPAYVGPLSVIEARSVRSMSAPKKQLSREEAAQLLGAPSDSLPEGSRWTTGNVVAHALNPWVELITISH